MWRKELAERGDVRWKVPGLSTYHLERILCALTDVYPGDEFRMDGAAWFTLQMDLFVFVMSLCVFFCCKYSFLLLLSRSNLHLFLPYSSPLINIVIAYPSLNACYLTLRDLAACLLEEMLTADYTRCGVKFTIPPHT
ncbi:hypothetical protein PoB_000645900 [Plakobranchus ocellatus]|uniref:Uncharacterized protein n=1 Tax=Plakobranchus ocellatus TaxID=259542 RepID=A0AAV3YCH9_9GAST|nr:hypothetical protein PoB_000645900 [Plakobranchus ocellatus]